MQQMKVISTAALIAASLLVNTAAIAFSLPPLRPKPGYIVGRVLTNQGRPLLPMEIHVQGFPTGSVLELAENFSPPIDPRTGYFEIRIEDGAYRVTARFNKRVRDSTLVIDCLHILDGPFVMADGTPYNRQPFSDSRQGIVRDLIWNPDPYFMQRCGGALGF
jgi:hypothetical protein